VVETTTTIQEAAETMVLGDPDGDGNVAVAIDGGSLAPQANGFSDSDPSDPYYFIHTQQDDLFVGIEMYTLFGDGWTGDLGTFPTDCGTHGICVYFDLDGTGPAAAMGPATGEITITNLDDGAVVTLDMVTFTDASGTTYTISNLTLGA